jgi:hypothetical protein
MLLGERTISRRRENTVVSALGVVSVTSCCVHLHSQVTLCHSPSVAVAWSVRSREGVRLRRSINWRIDEDVLNGQPDSHKSQVVVLDRIQWQWCFGCRKGVSDKADLT